MSHVTRTSIFKVKRSNVQGHQAALLAALLAPQAAAAAAVGVGTCWPWETDATLPSARRHEALRRPQVKERGWGISWRTPAYRLFELTLQFITN